MKPEGVWVEVAPGIEELRAPDAPPPTEVDRLAAQLELDLLIEQIRAKQLERAKG